MIVTTIVDSASLLVLLDATDDAEESCAAKSRRPRGRHCKHFRTEPLMVCLAIDMLGPRDYALDFKVYQEFWRSMSFRVSEGYEQVQGLFPLRRFLSLISFFSSNYGDVHITGRGLVSLLQWLGDH